MNLPTISSCLGYLTESDVQRLLHYAKVPYVLSIEGASSDLYIPEMKAWGMLKSVKSYSGRPELGQFQKDFKKRFGREARFLAGDVKYGYQEAGGPKNTGTAFTIWVLPGHRQSIRLMPFSDFQVLCGYQRATPWDQRRMLSDAFEVALGEVHSAIRSMMEAVEEYERSKTGHYENPTTKLRIPGGRWLSDGTFTFLSARAPATSTANKQAQDRADIASRALLDLENFISGTSEASLHEIDTSPFLGDALLRGLRPELGIDLIIEMKAATVNEKADKSGYRVHRTFRLNWQYAQWHFWLLRMEKDVFACVPAQEEKSVAEAETIDHHHVFRSATQLLKFISDNAEAAHRHRVQQVKAWSNFELGPKWSPLDADAMVEDSLVDEQGATDEAFGHTDIVSTMNDMLSCSKNGNGYIRALPRGHPCGNYIYIIPSQGPNTPSALASTSCERIPWYQPVLNLNLVEAPSRASMGYGVSERYLGESGHIQVQSRFAGYLDSVLGIVGSATGDYNDGAAYVSRYRTTSEVVEPAIREPVHRLYGGDFPTAMNATSFLPPTELSSLSRFCYRLAAYGHSVRTALDNVPIKEPASQASPRQALKNLLGTRIPERIPLSCVAFQWEVDQAMYDYGLSPVRPVKV